MLTFEIGLLAVVAVMAVMAFVHSWRARGRRQAVLLLVLGGGFGYLFPVIDINLFGQYIFHGRLTFLNLPVHLGMAWYGLYVLALCLAEYLAGPNAGRARVAVLAGILFGMLEAQWDPTLLALGQMELFLPSFHRYPLGFNPGLPLAHAYLGFAFAYAYLTLKDAERPWAAFLSGLASLVVLPLGVLAAVPLFEPIYTAVGERVTPWLAVTLDVVHFATTFAVLGLVAAWWFRRLSRWLAAPA